MIREAFRSQGRACAALGSPFMGRLMPLFAERLEHGTPVADHILSWCGDPSPSCDSVPLRVAGALHALKLTRRALENVYPPSYVDDDALWSAVSAAMQTHQHHFVTWLQSPPQTNEVRRAAALLPALALVNKKYTLPVELLELGASAGLNLGADLFRLELPGRILGHGASSVVLAPDWSGCVPGGSLPKVVARRGVDLSPIDPLSEAGRLKLLAYIWPDQPDRIQLTEAAINVSRTIQPELTADDAGDWVEAVLAYPADDRLRVIYHTVAWQYFPQATKDQITAALQTSASPLVRIGMEADGGQGAALTLTDYPSGKVEHLARVDFHGRWVAWSQ